jgi:hypothetical protein
MALVSTSGQPGKPGEDPIGRRGGKGGEGGAGGQGEPEGEGGKGGAGGAGEDMRGPRGYEGPSGRGSPRLAWVGYLILAIGVCLGLYVSYNSSQREVRLSHEVINERATRSQELDRYLAKSCRRGVVKDNVYIEILRDSIASVRASPQYDAAVKQAYIKKTLNNIARIRAVEVQCKQQIPPPLPHH